MDSTHTCKTRGLAGPTPFSSSEEMAVPRHHMLMVCTKALVPVTGSSKGRYFCLTLHTQDFTPPSSFPISDFLMVCFHLQKTLPSFSFHHFCSPTLKRHILVLVPPSPPNEVPRGQLQPGNWGHWVSLNQHTATTWPRTLHLSSQIYYKHVSFIYSSSLLSVASSLLYDTD